MYGLTSGEREQIRERLEARRRELERQIDAIGPSLDQEQRALRAAGPHDPTDDAELGRDEENSAALEHHLEAELRRVLAALSRLGTGDYGTCAACGEPIPTSRLMTYPEAEHCIGCQSQAERTGGR